MVQVGYSGGALSTGHASALQPTYAPDLSSTMVGWAHGGTPSNLTAVVQYIDGGLAAGFAFSGVAGLLLDYPTLNARFQQIATPAAQTAISYSRSHCSSDVLNQYRGESIETTKYQSLGNQLFYDPVVKSTLATLILGTNKSETPQQPTFIYVRREKRFSSDLAALCLR